MTPWIQTYTGRAFDPISPREADIDILDIAHSLSLTCRFGGHCPKFYSVAEHSLLMTMAVSDKHKLAALLHDAAEAYIGDIPSPLKRQLDINDIELRLNGLIQHKFNLPIGALQHPAITHADRRMLASEMEILFPDRPADWELGVEPYPRGAVRIQHLSPLNVEDKFMRVFSLLSAKDTGGLDWPA